MKRRLVIAAVLLIAFSVSAKEIPDVDVVDQSGHPLHFYRDLVAQKVVVIAFFFTQCQDACPVVAHTLLHLQTALGERVGRDVSIVSVSIDPQHDTPAVLAQWGKDHGVKPGWTLVTGDPAAIDRVTRAFTGDNARIGLHSIVVYVGNARTGEWICDSGSLSTQHYLDLLARLSR